MVGEFHCSFKERMIGRIGLFDESVSFGPDYDLLIRISKKFHFEYNDVLVKYYFHENKIWTNPETLSKGMAITLKKYSESSALRKYYSQY